MSFILRLPASLRPMLYNIYQHNIYLLSCNFSDLNCFFWHITTGGPQLGNSAKVTRHVVCFGHVGTILSYRLNSCINLEGDTSVSITLPILLLP